MTYDESRPTGSARDQALEEAAAQPLDASDVRLLADVASAYDAMDPVPRDLVRRVQFALALDEVYEEVARITRVPMDALATRSADASTRTETLTFSAEQLSAMVTITALKGHVRLDGWLTPGESRRVHLRMDDRELECVADETGRFVFEEVPRGFAQLSFHPADGSSEAVVVTPMFEL